MIMLFIKFQYSVNEDGYINQQGTCRKHVAHTRIYLDLEIYYIEIEIYKQLTMPKSCLLSFIHVSHRN